MKRNGQPIFVGLCAGLAFHSHPYAAAFAAGLVVYYLVEALRLHRGWKTPLLFALLFVAAVAPWLIWSRFLLGLPSDLVWQNFAGAGTEAARTSVIDFVWVRLRVLYDVCAPVFFGVFPFDAARVSELAENCLPGAVGLLLIAPGIASVLRAKSQQLVWLAIVLPFCVIATLFNYPARPLMHGGQAIVGALVFCGVDYIRRRAHGRTFRVVVVTQLVMNLAFIALRLGIAGARLP